MKKLASLLLVSMLAFAAYAEADPNFYIYLCFGQSNMEGNAQWENIDNQVDGQRFRLLATCNYDNPKRTMGQWYNAVPPLVNPIGKLGPTDYFGRTMVAALPTNIKVGVVPVAIGGCRIEMFDKDKYKDEVNKGDYSAGLANSYYGGNPYQRLVDMAKKAQEVGVIKGMLLHQGCSNCNDPNWPDMVKKIYRDILAELGLKAKDVPLFAGETEYADMGGGCSDHNNVVAQLPSKLKFSDGTYAFHVVSAYGLPGNGSDPWHFSAVGYRTFGKRYAYEVLRTMGLEPKANPEYEMPSNLKKFFTVTSFETTLSSKANSTVTLKLMATFADGHKEDLTRETTFTSTDFTITSKGTVKLGAEGTSGIVQAVYTDFFGTVYTLAMTIATPTAIASLPSSNTITPKWTPVYTLQGRKVGFMEQWDSLPADIYVVNGKKIVKTINN